MEDRRSVILAIDASKQAQEACDFYLNHLHKAENTVIMVHAADISDADDDGVKADKLERAYSRYMTSRGVQRVKSRTDGASKPGHMICQVASEENASMVVIGTRGMGKLRRTLMGSVSDYVLHHAICPVIIVRRAEDKGKKGKNEEDEDEEEEEEETDAADDAQPGSSTQSN